MRARARPVHRLSTKYAVHLTVDVTLVGRTDGPAAGDADSLLHFEMSVVDASYVDNTADSIIEQHRSEFASVPSQSARDAAYLRSMSKPLYFVQTCAGQVVQIFHPRTENVAILNMKKSFLQTISLKMSDTKDAEHVEEHHGALATRHARARARASGAQTCEHIAARTQRRRRR